MSSHSVEYFGLNCPVPISEYRKVLLAHGSGGKLTHQLIEKMFLPQFKNPLLEPLHDGAVISLNGTRLAFSTDSYVVSPIFFPGGDIGELAVNGTVNDLAMCGARPLYLSVGLIIEEGLPMDDLWRVVLSIQRAAERAGVLVVTGDTKVVDRGKADKIFVNTSGVGVIEHDVQISPSRVVPGDKVLLSGRIAEHGIAIMSVREGLEFETELRSDTAPLHELVARIIEAGGEGIHVLRDPTRGGVASALNEIAMTANIGIEIVEESIPMSEEVRGACEILGLDPLYVANEGKLLACVSPQVADRVLEVMRLHPAGKESVIIGEVVECHAGTVVLRSRIGGLRVVDMLSGEQLPRIC
ncbi:MAG TPA: hydrogenase expression/formation protein HypE [Bacteroidota bacterium]|nr:hydrogenase expression/formation protein HypE [Bacteroidota bacterium]